MNDAPSTEELLLQEFGDRPIVSLAEVCERYAGVKHYQAKKLANMNKLPFPAFRLNPHSHRAAWMVNLKELARAIDDAAKASTKSWKSSQL
jgi:hypothetical protein